MMNRYIIIAICFFALLATPVIGDGIYTYERDYQDGNSTNDDDPNNIITVNGYEDDKNAGFKLTYYIINNTIVIHTWNLDNVTINLNRALNDVNPTCAEWLYLYTTIKYYSDTITNLTIVDAPIIVGCDYPDYETDGNDYYVYNITTGTYHIYPLSTPVDDLDKVKDTCSVCWIILAIICVAIFYMRRNNG